MANEGVNQGRRRFLTATTVVVGGAGVVAAAVPFIKTWMPSARAKTAGAPVTVDISKLEVGQMLTVGGTIPEWRGQPIWIIHRSDEQLAALPAQDARLKDAKSENEDQQPKYAQNGWRSFSDHKNIMVLVGICTHLGCSPKFHGELKPEPFDDQWKGGFFCPCHKSRFDMAGRVYNGVPAPANLKVPPYKFADANTLLIGVNPEGAAA
jgi:ubiquinol-cytochrome c reductase iron-sulfur subunit